MLFRISFVDYVNLRKKVNIPFYFFCYFVSIIFFVFIILYIPHFISYYSILIQNKKKRNTMTLTPQYFPFLITLFSYCFISLHTSPIPSNAPLPLPGRPWKRSIPGCSASGGAAPGHARRLVWRGQRRYPQVFLPYLPAW